MSQINGLLLLLLGSSWCPRLDLDLAVSFCSTICCLRTLLRSLKCPDVPGLLPPPPLATSPEAFFFFRFLFPSDLPEPSTPTFSLALAAKLEAWGALLDVFNFILRVVEIGVVKEEVRVEVGAVPERSSENQESMVDRMGWW